MTNKDMNLSLDQGPVQSTAKFDTTPETQSPQKVMETRKRLRLNWQLIAFSSLALANMAFMLLIVSWLPQHAEQSQSEFTRIQNKAITQIEHELEGIKKQLAGLEQSNQILKVSLGQQQQLIIATTKDISAQIRTATVNGETPAKLTSSGTTKNSPKQWYVNLGTFSDKRVAAELQQQVKSLGHSANINPITDNESENGAIVYQLRIPGFKDQESAEAVATQLMEGSDLNGLWVWKEG